MPNRIIREGILTSERVNSLNWEEEVFYRRLLSVVDDYGRCEAHAALLRASLFPLKLNTIRESNVERLLTKLEQARLVRLYHVAHKRYLEVLDFRQQTRSASKHPPAPDTQSPSACVADATQPIADAHLGVSVSVVGDGGVVGGGTFDRPRRPSTTPKETPTRDECVAYFADLGAPAFEADKFFDHFEANGWRQGGRARLRDWKAAARNWVRRLGEFVAGGGAGKMGGVGRGAAGASFDPKAPHAHTGGLPVFNDAPQGQEVAP